MSFAICLFYLASASLLGSPCEAEQNFNLKLAIPPKLTAFGFSASFTSPGLLLGCHRDFSRFHFLLKNEYCTSLQQTRNIWRCRTSSVCRN